MKILDKRIETIDKQIGEMSIIKNNPQKSQNDDLSMNNKNNTNPINQYSITGKLGGDTIENMNSQKNFSSFNNNEFQKNIEILIQSAHNLLCSSVALTHFLSC